MAFIPILLTVITTILAFYLGFSAFSTEKMKILYINWVYYILIANILLWFIAIVETKSKNCSNRIINYCKKHKWAILLAFLLTLCGALVSKPEFRILADETNLLSISEALYEDRECKNLTSATYYYYGFKSVISYEIDKRPALFPLTVSFLHSLTGYRPENAFIVNILSCFFSLIIFYNLVTSRFGRFWGKCAMVLLSAYPLWVLYYTSAGFEVFNLLFSLILFWYLAKFIKEPTAANAEVMFFVLPLISQTRYESSVALLSAIPAVFLMLPRLEYRKFSYKLFLIPLLFVPVAWLRLLTDNARGLQVDEVGKAAFAWEHFSTNIKKALMFFRGDDIAYGMIPVITYLAIAGFILLFIIVVTKALKDKKLNYKRTLFWSGIFLFYFLHAIIRFAYYWGDLTYRFNSRLGIIFLPIVVFFAVSFLYYINLMFKSRKVYFALFSVTLLLVYWPVAGLNLGVRELTLYREFRAAKEYLEKFYPNKNEYILVADRANLYVPLKYSTVSFNYCWNNIGSLKNSLENRTYNHLLFLQTIDKASGKALSKCSIPSSIKPEMLYETQIKADQYLRVSIYSLYMDKDLLLDKKFLK
ncbi:MAG: glycosyltransferase family 39 protein [Candidatus Riflebacteria bacterium]|nr:glycosyltransferase family 39 protein [Candidatus Riflebacteria bacterium]